MAVEFFLKLTDNPGESKAQGHEGEIDVMSFSIGVSNTSAVSTGGGSGAGKCDWQDLHITKLIDKSSAKLKLNCAKGTHFDEGTLTVREAGGDEPVEYLTYKMKQVYITSYQTGGSSGNEKPLENLTLSFASIGMTYWSQSEKGAKDEKSEMGWDIKKNAAAAA